MRTILIHEMIVFCLACGAKNGILESALFRVAFITKKKPKKRRENKIKRNRRTGTGIERKSESMQRKRVENSDPKEISNEWGMSTRKHVPKLIILSNHIGFGRINFYQKTSDIVSGVHLVRVNNKYWMCEACLCVCIVCTVHRPKFEKWLKSGRDETSAMTHSWCDTTWIWWRCYQHLQMTHEVIFVQSLLSTSIGRTIFPGNCFLSIRKPSSVWGLALAVEMVHHWVTTHNSNTKVHILRTTHSAAHEIFIYYYLLSSFDVNMFYLLLLSNACTQRFLWKMRRIIGRLQWKQLNALERL